MIVRAGTVAGSAGLATGGVLQLEPLPRDVMAQIDKLYFEGETLEEGDEGEEGDER